MICSTAIGCKKKNNITIEYPKFTSYLEIPGVTQKEIEAIENIKLSRSNFAYGVNYSTEAFLINNYRIGGFSALFCDWLSGLFEIPFKPQIVDWDELISGLADKKIDFTGELTATDERREIYFMTGPIAERSIKIMRIKKSEPLQVLAKIRPLVYMFLEGTTAHDMVAPYLPDGYRSIFVGDYETAYHFLKNGTADAFFEDGPAEAAFDTHDDVHAEDFYPLIYAPVSFTTQNPDLAPFISVIDKALNSGFVYHLTMMYNQGYNNYLRQRLSMQLTFAEKMYITQHRTPETAIKLAAEYDNYPVSFYNSYEKEWQGIAIDVLREIEAYTGLCFTMAHDENTEWSEVLQMLEDGRASMNTELLIVQNRLGRFV